jgi:hypothetical protein
MTYSVADFIWFQRWLDLVYVSKRRNSLLAVRPLDPATHALQ